MAKKSKDTSLGDQFLGAIIKSVPGVIDTVTKAVTTSVTSASSAETHKDESTDKASAPEKHTSGHNSPQKVWEGIGCSTKTALFIEMALVDGVIDSQERAMISKRATAEGVDMEELEFLIAKRLEAIELVNRNAIKELSQLFREAEKASAGEIKPDMSAMASLIPACMSLAPAAGTTATTGLTAAAGISTGGAAIAATAAVAVIGQFIKEPSKLNEFKAEIIRMIRIPMLPSVISEFFAYATSQIKQERQKVEGKGYFTVWSESLFGKELELEPIWHEKMSAVMTETVARYGNDITVMESVKPYRHTPLMKFMERKDDKDFVLTFPTPKLAPDFIELLRYLFKLSQDSRNNRNDLADSYYYLCEKMRKDGRQLADRFPEVASVINECRFTSLTDLKANLQNPDFLIMFNLPEDYDDASAVLQYTSSKPELKELHRRLYNRAMDLFENDTDKISKLKAFRPKNIFGF